MWQWGCRCGDGGADVAMVQMWRWGCRCDGDADVVMGKQMWRWECRCADGDGMTILDPELGAPYGGWQTLYQAKPAYC